jgi:hypothetical protein
LFTCRIHRIECGRDGWFCPICDEDRCRECEYHICAVDGRKKDVQCTFKCRFCNKFAGVDHRLHCQKCETEGCSNCIRKSFDEKKLCPDCSFTCIVCGNVYQTTKHLKCEICHSYICPLCDLVRCPTCQKMVCDHDTYQCSDCGKTYCNNCVGGHTTDNNRILCRECVNTCSVCEKVIGKSAAVVTTTGEIACRRCVRKCDRCRKDYRVDSLVRCTISRENVCHHHTYRCPACGNHVCKEHTSVCSLCETRYCSKCMPDNKEDICMLCRNLKLLKSGPALEFVEKHLSVLWKLGSMGTTYSEGSKIYIFSFNDRGVTTLVTVDKEYNKVIKTKKFDFFSRLKYLKYFFKT